MLFHHAPERTDEQIDALLAAHQARLAEDRSALVLHAAAEGTDLVIGRGGVSEDRR